MTLATFALHLLLASATPLHAPGACEVSGETRSAPDVSRAARACEAARARFEALLGGPVPEVSVVLWEESGYRTGVMGDRAVIYWPTGRSLAETDAQGGPSPFGDDPWTETLPHEIAHVLLASRLFGSGPQVSAGPGGYGTPLPDWLDEAVAIWAEPPRSRALRLGDARALPKARVGLREIMSAGHPGAGDPAIMAMRDGAAPPSDEELAAFYPRSIALLGFVFDRGGGAAVQRLIAQLRRDPAAGPRALLGLPGMPSNPEALESDWRLWLKGESARSAAAR